MAEMKNFKRDFVKRTIEILDKNYENTEYEVTLLLNCLLGMVSLPIEDKKSSKDNHVVQFENDCVQKLKQLSIKFQSNDSTDQLFRNIRNSICHMHIEPSAYQGYIENINFRNFSNGNKGKLTFWVIISVENLREFANYVAKEYLSRFF